MTVGLVGAEANIVEGREGGLAPYDEAWAWQREIWAERVAGKRPDTFLLVQHPHTFTMGLRAKAEHLVWDSSERIQKGVNVVQIDRGGDVTYHGPGQLVVYPIVDLQVRRMDLHQYLRALEDLGIGVLKEYGVEGGRIKGYTGVWAPLNGSSSEGVSGEMNMAKIGAIGIKVSKWVTMHGMAFNVSPDLSYFSGIVPCGLCGKPVTSLRNLLGRQVPIEEVTSKMASHIGRVFGVASQILTWDQRVNRA